MVFFSWKRGKQGSRGLQNGSRGVLGGPLKPLKTPFMGPTPKTPVLVNSCFFVVSVFLIGNGGNGSKTGVGRKQGFRGSSGPGAWLGGPGAWLGGARGLFQGSDGLKTRLARRSGPDLGAEGPSGAWLGGGRAPPSEGPIGARSGGRLGHFRARIWGRKTAIFHDRFHPGILGRNGPVGPTFLAHFSGQLLPKKK